MHDLFARNGGFSPGKFKCFSTCQDRKRWTTSADLAAEPVTNSFLATHRRKWPNLFTVLEAPKKFVKTRICECRDREKKWELTNKQKREREWCVYSRVFEKQSHRCWRCSRTESSPPVDRRKLRCTWKRKEQKKFFFFLSLIILNICDFYLYLPNAWKIRGQRIANIKKKQSRQILDERGTLKGIKKMNWKYGDYGNKMYDSWDARSCGFCKLKFWY